MPRFATITLPWLLLLQPLGDTMLDVKEQLCGGNQTFVISHNSDSQLTYGLVTARDRGGEHQLSVSELAVDAHKFHDPRLPERRLGARALYDFRDVSTRMVLNRLISMCI